MVVEHLGIKVGVELPIEHNKNVAIKRRGDFGTVIVGSNETIWVLDEIRTKEKVVHRTHACAKVAQQALSLIGLEVANRATEKSPQLSVSSRNVWKMKSKVADNSANVNVVGLTEGLGRFNENVATDVEQGDLT
jgi:hypothetical protein